MEELGARPPFRPQFGAALCRTQIVRVRAYSIASARLLREDSASRRATKRLIRARTSP